MRRSISHGQTRVKLALLLQRAFRYSYREKCCGYCPTILCKLFFPLLLRFILLFVRYASNALTSDFVHNSTNTFPEFFNERRCSQDLDQIVQLAKLAQKKLNEFSCGGIRVSSEMPDGERHRELLHDFTVIVDFSPPRSNSHDR